MKKIIIAATIVLTAGILSTAGIKKNVKPLNTKLPTSSMSVRNDLALATAD